MTLRARFAVGMTVQFKSFSGQTVAAEVTSFSSSGSHVHISVGRTHMFALTESDARKRLLAPGEDPVLARLTAKQRELLTTIRQFPDGMYLKSCHVRSAKSLAALKVIDLVDNGVMPVGPGHRSRGDGKRWFCKPTQPSTEGIEQ